MSARLARSSRAVIVDAVERAHSEGANEVREEHLLAAVLSEPAMQPLLREMHQLPDAAVLLAEVRRARRRGGLSAVEADALAGELGIDLDAVVDRVEGALGEGALDATRGPARRGRIGPSVSAEVDAVLRAAARQASARGDGDLRTEHVLLGLLAQPGLVADTLGRRGATVATVLAVLDARDAQAGAGR